jgi:SAM-dependent methyltransferase
MVGHAFVDFLLAYATPDRSATIVEIGPGYGRILSALLERGALFQRYIGLELSAARVAKLSAAFTDPRIEFRQADVFEAIELGVLADLTFGSAVFEHFYPDFAPVLRTVAGFTKTGGRLVFDLIRTDEALGGGFSHFEADHHYARQYGIAELIELFTDSPFTLDAIGKISFGRGADGLEVVRTVIRGTK